MSGQLIGRFFQVELHRSFFSVMKILTVAVTNLTFPPKIEHAEKCPKHFHKIPHYTSYVFKCVDMSLLKNRKQYLVPNAYCCFVIPDERAITVITRLSDTIAHPVSRVTSMASVCVHFCLL